MEHVYDWRKVGGFIVIYFLGNKMRFILEIDVRIILQI